MVDYAALAGRRGCDRRFASLFAVASAGRGDPKGSGNNFSFGAAGLPLRTFGGCFEMADGGECCRSATGSAHQRTMLYGRTICHAFFALDYWRRCGASGGGFAQESESSGRARGECSRPACGYDGAGRVGAAGNRAAAAGAAGNGASGSAEDDSLCGNWRWDSRSVHCSIVPPTFWRTFRAVPEKAGAVAACSTQRVRERRVFWDSPGCWPRRFKWRSWC